MNPQVPLIVNFQCICNFLLAVPVHIGKHICFLLMLRQSHYFLLPFVIIFHPFLCHLHGISAECLSRIIHFLTCSKYWGIRDRFDMPHNSVSQVSCDFCLLRDSANSKCSIFSVLVYFKSLCFQT